MNLWITVFFIVELFLLHSYHFANCKSTGRVIFPLFQSAYDGMIANFINREITKGTHKKGIQVDMNN